MHEFLLLRLVGPYVFGLVFSDALLNPSDDARLALKILKCKVTPTAVTSAIFH